MNHVARIYARETFAFRAINCVHISSSSAAEAGIKTNLRKIKGIRISAILHFSGPTVSYITFALIQKLHSYQLLAKK